MTDRPMTRDEALARFREMADPSRYHDIESEHSEADDILLALLNDPEVTEAYEAIEKWYA